MMGFLEAARLFQRLFGTCTGNILGKVWWQEDWDFFVETMNKLHKKYNRSEFAKDMLLAIAKEIEKATIDEK